MYIRKLSLDELMARLEDFWQARDPDFAALMQSQGAVFRAVAEALQTRLVTLLEFDELARFAFEDPKTYDPDLLLAKGGTLPEICNVFERAVEALGNVPEWTHESLETTLRALADSLGVKAGMVLWPIRAALTGLSASPGVFEVLLILGQETSLRRLRSALDLLRSV